MRYFTLALVLVCAVCLTSCLEDESIIASPDGSTTITQFNRVPAQPSDMVGESFSMADISLKVNGVTEESFSMAGCFLSMLEANCDEDCRTRLDEDGSVLTFNNTYVARPGTEYQGVKFLETNDQGSGGARGFLRNEVLPLLTNAEWQVEKEGNNFVLTCEDCPIDRYGRSYTERVIRLRK